MDINPLLPPRFGRVARRTAETDIRVSVGLDGSGAGRIATGIGFLDHMLDQLARHGGFDLDINVEGDLHIDAHHSTEDCGLALGEAIAQALGDKRGVERYGHAYAPMDEALTRVALDLSGRPFLVWQVPFTQPQLGTMDTELFREFFQAVSQKAGITLHVETLHGINNHHIAESVFKGFARALRAAVKRDPARLSAVPSTKGTLTASLPLDSAQA